MVISVCFLRHNVQIFIKWIIRKRKFYGNYFWIEKRSQFKHYYSALSSFLISMCSAWLSCPCVYTIGSSRKLCPHKSQDNSAANLDCLKNMCSAAPKLTIILTHRTPGEDIFINSTFLLFSFVNRSVFNNNAWLLRHGNYFSNFHKRFIWIIFFKNGLSLD